MTNQTSINDCLLFCLIFCSEATTTTTRLVDILPQPQKGKKMAKTKQKVPDNDDDENRAETPQKPLAKKAQKWKAPLDDAEPSTSGACLSSTC